MRKKLLLLLAISMSMASSAWADLGTTTIGGKTYYQIGSAADLADLAKKVNGGEFTANAVLTGNIDMSELTEWTAIGDWGAISKTSSACYKGHFDGQGYTINNFTFTSTHNYYGIFGVISTGALIENFTIHGTMDLGHKTGGVVGYTRDATPTIRNIRSDMTINVTEAETTAERPGGIVGSAVNGTTVVENCTYSGTINVGGHTGNIGGIVGYVNNNAAAIVNVTNCLFNGEIKNGTAKGECGGIIGFNNAGTVTITGCLSLGTITSGKAGQFFGALNGNNSTYAGYNYYVGAAAQTGSGTATGTAPAVVNSTQLASGEICYKLNGDQSNIGFYQTLPDDAVPTLDNSHKQVYANGSFKCDGVTPKGVITYSNTEGVSIDPHTYSDGICSACGSVDADYMSANGEGYYEIGTANQLKWFAGYVNQVDPAVNGKLTGNINLAGVAWTPIGVGSGNVAPGATAYAGTFDGQGYGITGFNAEGIGHMGLFGDANNATIKNFSISGTLNVTGGYCGGIVANLTNSNIENIHSSLVIDVPNGDTHHVGGVVGTARGGNNIEGCSFDGSMTVAEGSTDNSAGIAAYITNGDSVKNCVNYGNITFKDINCAAGGIVGYINAQQACVRNCLTVGKILFDGEGNPKYGGAILGRTKGFSTEKVTNNYWLAGSAYGSVKNNDGSDPEAAPSVTAEQLASGEVAYKLGAAFGQVIGTDANPVLGGEAVNYVGEAGYATLFDATQGYELKGDAEAFVGNVNGQYVSLTTIGKDVPAATPVVLRGTYYNKIAADIPAINIANQLKGSDGTVEGNGSIYALANKDNGVGFYKVKDGIAIPAGKVYLQTSNAVKEFFPFADDETAIENVNGNVNGNKGAIYNIAGQRLSKMQKGLNIVGGKKVMY